MVNILKLIFLGFLDSLPYIGLCCIFLYSEKNVRNEIRDIEIQISELKVKNIKLENKLNSIFLNESLKK